MPRLSVAAVSATLTCGAWVSHCAALSCCGTQALRSRASVVAVHGLRCSTACRILLDQGSNQCPWEADAYPLHHQGSPNNFNFRSPDLSHPPLGKKKKREIALLLITQTAGEMKEGSVWEAVGLVLGTVLVKY